MVIAALLDICQATVSTNHPLKKVGLQNIANHYQSGGTGRILIFLPPDKFSNINSPQQIIGAKGAPLLIDPPPWMTENQFKVEIPLISISYVVLSL